MQWVTKDFVHLDRVACPWLIKRFVDPDATFAFVPWTAQHTRPADAIPFAIAGTELGPHDEHGTTFDKILRKYKLDDPALAAIADVIRAGVDIVLHGHRPGPDDSHGVMAWGLLTLSEGMMLIRQADDAIIESSLVVYDALYAHFRTHHAITSGGLAVPKSSAGTGPGPATTFRREVWNSVQGR